MINYDNIKKLNSQIAIHKEKLETEDDLKNKAKLRLRIQINTLKIKLERLNY